MTWRARLVGPLVGVVAAASLLAGCSAGSQRAAAPSGPTGSTSPVSSSGPASPAPTPPPSTASTSPAASTSLQATRPPTSPPPVTTPPKTQPPTTRPPTTTPPTSQPHTTQPPKTKPPSTPPADSDPDSIAGKRIVAYYGAGTTAPGLGVLGQDTPDATWQKLAAQGAQYQDTGQPVQLAFELIATIADAGPGPDGLYRSRQSEQVISTYLAEVRKHHGILILDIQPGRSDFLTEAKALQKWLVQPDVGLALDPEWRMGPNQVPGKVIGSVTAAEVNSVASWLNGLVQSKHLPQKVLLLHKFRDHMIQDQSSIKDQPGLYEIINMDGFGSQSVKIPEYHEFAAGTDFAMGIKLFYKQDTDLMTPKQVMALKPRPDMVDYQ